MAVLVTNWEGASGVHVGSSCISRGEAGLEAVVASLATAESDRNAPTVGAHGFPNILGIVELDASLMDGTSLRTGAIGALSGYAHPILLAREVMKRLPHVLLVGEGAKRFAEECNAETAPPLNTDQLAYMQRFKDSLSEEARADWPPRELAPFAGVRDFATSKGTAVCLVRDTHGAIASGATTSGWPLKYPGRLGDSPIIGAGHYAHSKYGAAACTHTGEMTIRCLTAHSIVMYLKQGIALRDACFKALDDFRELKGGTIGHVVIHAIDAQDNAFVLSTGPANQYWVWKDDGSEATQLTPEISAL